MNIYRVVYKSGEMVECESFKIFLKLIRSYKRYLGYKPSMDSSFGGSFEIYKNNKFNIELTEKLNSL